MTGQPPLACSFLPTCFRALQDVALQSAPKNRRLAFVSGVIKIVRSVRPVLMTGLIGEFSSPGSLQAESTFEPYGT